MLDTVVHSMFLFFFNDTATTEIYTLSLHDALPILSPAVRSSFEPAGVRRRRESAHSLGWRPGMVCCVPVLVQMQTIDRKSTRLNSSHANISYAVFCLKKKNSSSTAPFSICTILIAL